MATPRFEKVVNGRLCRLFKHRSTIDVHVYAGSTAEGEPIAEWEMPIWIDWNGIAEQAERQTKRDK